MHPSVEHLLSFFAFSHLPAHLQAVSQPFHTLAWQVARGSSNAETSAALRKLLEAKDCAVRAMLVPKDESGPSLAMQLYGAYRSGGTVALPGFNELAAPYQERWDAVAAFVEKRRG